MLTEHNFSTNSATELVVSFHTKVHNCLTFSSLNTLCLRLAASIKVKSLAYHYLPQLNSVSDIRWDVMLAGFPKTLVERYRSEELTKVDASNRQIMKETHAHWWRTMDFSSRLSQKEKEYLDSVSSEVVGEGLIIPVFGPGGRNGFIVLGFGDHKPDWVEGVISLLHSCCQFAHLQFCKILQLEAPKESKLTPREKEILTWVAEGKSNRIIASVLGIAESTVVTHLERAFKKLGVDTRVTAVLRASSLGDLNNTL